MASTAQIEFFRKLTTEKDFGGQNVAELRERFADLSDKNASQWIEHALKLPKLSDEAEKASMVAPPF